jgi:dTDP-4-amino-4,6-dideoxygalactose transaminase
MRARNVQPTFHYVPLHSSPAGRKLTDVERECPVTDDISGRLMRLPFFNSITDDEIEHVVGALVAALDNAS